MHSDAVSLQFWFYHRWVIRTKLCYAKIITPATKLNYFLRAGVILLEVGNLACTWAGASLIKLLGAYLGA